MRKHMYTTHIELYIKVRTFPLDTQIEKKSIVDKQIVAYFRIHLFFALPGPDPEPVSFYSNFGIFFDRFFHFRVRSIRPGFQIK